MLNFKKIFEFFLNFLLNFSFFLELLKAAIKKNNYQHFLMVLISYYSHKRNYQTKQADFRLHNLHNFISRLVIVRSMDFHRLVGKTSYSTMIYIIKIMQKKIIVFIDIRTILEESKKLFLTSLLFVFTISTMVLFLFLNLKFCL